MDVGWETLSDDRNRLNPGWVKELFLVEPVLSNDGFHVEQPRRPPEPAKCRQDAVGVSAHKVVLEPVLIIVVRRWPFLVDVQLIQALLLEQETVSVQEASAFEVLELAEVLKGGVSDLIGHALAREALG